MRLLVRMRRLYSTFAGSWPGAGLLLLRLVVGSVVLVGAGSKLWSAAPLQTMLTSASLAGSGLLLIAGLWTPLAGTAVAAIEILQVLTMAEDPLVCLMAGTVGGALAMLGPGRWSMDAQLFGWKLIEAPPRRSSSNVP
jgi:putative oxidoreductase